MNTLDKIHNWLQEKTGISLKKAIVSGLLLSALHMTACDKEDNLPTKNMTASAKVDKPTVHIDTAKVRGWSISSLLDKVTQVTAIFNEKTETPNIVSSSQTPTNDTSPQITIPSEKHIQYSEDSQISIEEQEILLDENFPTEGRFTEQPPTQAISQNIQLTKYIPKQRKSFLSTTRSDIQYIRIQEYSTPHAWRSYQSDTIYLNDAIEKENIQDAYLARETMWYILDKTYGKNMQAFNAWAQGNRDQGQRDHFVAELWLTHNLISYKQSSRLIGDIVALHTNPSYFKIALTKSIFNHIAHLTQTPLPDKELSNKFSSKAIMKSVFPVLQKKAVASWFETSRDVFSKTSPSVQQISTFAVQQSAEILKHIDQKDIEENILPMLDGMGEKVLKELQFWDGIAARKQVGR